MTDLETPALVVDADALDANLARMASIPATHGKAWRPHAKGHKTPEIALRQLTLGAIGITCAKLSEAQVFANAGIRELLIANVVTGPAKLERLVELCRTATPIIACDHYAQALPMAEACHRAGVECRVLVDVDVGMNRTGTRPGVDALELALAIDRLPGLKLVGLMGYEGHVMTATEPAEKAAQVRSAMGVLGMCRDQFRQRGLCCEIVSAGGTGSIELTSACEAVTELQAGGGIFGDPFYTDRCGLTGVRPALTLIATVISRPSLERAILDVGRKATSPEPMPPRVHGWPDAKIVALHAEHALLDLGPASQSLRIGDRVSLVVGYADFTTILHERMYVMRDGAVEAVWPIAARGCLQ